MMVSGILQIVHDGTGEIAHDGQALGLDDFTQMELVEIAQAPADFLQHVKRQMPANVGAARAFRHGE